MKTSPIVVTCPGLDRFHGFRRVENQYGSSHWVPQRRVEARHIGTVGVGRFCQDERSRRSPGSGNARSSPDGELDAHAPDRTCPLVVPRRPVAAQALHRAPYIGV